MSSSCAVFDADLVVAAALRPVSHLESPRQAAEVLMSSAWQTMNTALKDSKTEFVLQDGKYSCAAKPQVDAGAAQAYWQKQKVSPLERDEFDAVASEELTRLLSEALVNEAKGYSRVELTIQTNLRVDREGEVDYKMFIDFTLQWPRTTD